MDHFTIIAELVVLVGGRALNAVVALVELLAKLGIRPKAAPPFNRVILKIHFVGASQAFLLIQSHLAHFEIFKI